MTTNPPPSQITSDSTWREQAIALARKVMTISEMLKTKGEYNPLSGEYAHSDMTNQVLEEASYLAQKVWDKQDEEREENEDYDPTPQFLWDHTGGEPPITLDEMHKNEYAKKLALNS
jgi:hypothetical protein